MKRNLLAVIMMVACSIVFGQYVVNFEGTGETKTAYASGNVTLSGISWNLTEALIGTDTSDWKNGVRSTRLRGYGITSLTMQANKSNGLGTLSFGYRRYGTDAQVDWKAEYSIDNGSNWIQIGSTFTAPASDVVQQFSVAVNISGDVRIRIKRATESGSTNMRLNIDDITLTDYAGLGLPSVSTTAISNITQTTATSGGNVTSDGGATVTARGVCWSTTANPDTGDFLSSDGSGTGSFVSSLSSLSAATLYYVRAYATNSQGTAYGEEYSFSTSGNSPPNTPVATSATNVGINSFTANWNAATGATSYRLDVSTNSAFTAILGSYNNLTVASTSQAVSGLSAGTNYYYRVRAYNTNGTSASSNTITVTTQANDPYNGYYNPVVGLSGTALQTGLHDLIDSNTYSNYDGAKLFLFQELDNTGGVVRCVYTGQDFTVGSSYDGASNPNTEHTYAQSWFSSAESSIKKADLHHLFVSNSSVNSSRGNLPFDVVTNVGTTYPSYNGYVSKRGTNSSGDTVFEPADQHKGNLARALLYFNVRYGQTLSQGGVDMLETLLTWHNADPVDAAELTRNAAMFGHQGNRNPFVDHPEYVSSIWGGSTANTTVQFSPASALVNEADGSVTLFVQITNPSATTATTAQIALSSGSATDVGNFTTRSISFPANSSASQSTTVTITNDSILEGSETLVFSLINVSGGNSAVIGNYGSFNLEIEDNDIPTPVATAATNLGFTGFTATWNAAAGISDYQFDLSTSSSFTTFVEGYESLRISASSLAITGLAQGTDYFYRVRSVYLESIGTNSNTITATTNAIIYLETPVATAASAVSHEGFTAHWNPVTGADAYRLDVFTSSQTYQETNVSFEGSSTSMPPTGWTLSATGSYILSNTSNAHGGSVYAGLNAVSGWVMTPLINSPSTCSFWVRTSAATAVFTAKVQTSPNGYDWSDQATYTALSGDSGTITSAYSLASVSLDLIGEHYIRWIIATRSGGSFYLDDVTITGLEGTDTYVAGYQDLPVSTNIARVSGLNADTSYSYRIRATNTGDTSENSNLIQVQTTAVIMGTGANTAIGGSATEVLIPVISGLSNNNVIVDPSVSSSDDFSVAVSAIAGGIRYTITCANDTAFNGSYVFKHSGLGYAPQTVHYSYNGNTLIPASIAANTTQTSFTLSGLSSASTGVLTVDLLQAAASLGSPVPNISLNSGNIRLQWSAVSGASLYRIVSSDTPDGVFTLVGTTSNLYYEHASSIRRFYKVIALN